MADVNLDDLIKKDKEKNHGNKKHIKGKFDKKSKFNKREHQNNDRSNNQTQKPREENNNNKNFKTKIIHKRFNNQNNDRQENRQENRNNNNQKKENFKQNRVHEQKNEQNKQKFFRTLKVMGLSTQFTNEDLYKLFATEGALEKCLIEQDNFGRSLTTALVKYHNPESARNAIQNLDKHKIMNCILTVQPYKNIKK